jgi:GGDEF domain-containing protein
VIEQYGSRYGRRITASVGVACVPDDVPPVPDDLLATAEAALYEAKRAGKNVVAERDRVLSPEVADPRRPL